MIDALAYLALGTLLGMAIVIVPQMLADTQAVGEAGDNPDDSLTHDGDTRAINLLRRFHDGEI